jgi:extracellular elastinolytic metalloproteinase
MIYRSLAFRLATFALVSACGTVAAAQDQPEGRRAVALESRTSQSGFLAGPADGSALDVALRYIDEHKDELGLSASDLADTVVASEHVSDINGVTHIYLTQRYQGIEVNGAQIGIHIMSDGSVLNLSNSFVPDLAEAVSGLAPTRDAGEAGERAARHLGLRQTRAMSVRQARGGPSAETVLDGAGVAREDIKARLVYEPVEGGKVRLAWLVDIDQIDGQNWWNITVDAQSGEVLGQHSLTAHDSWDSPDAYEAAHWRPATSLTATPEEKPLRIVESMDARVRGSSTARLGVPVAGSVPNSGTYRVYPYPLADPNDGGRILEVSPADSFSSSFGWHDTNGAPGAESSQTVGNNVDAYLDINNDNTAAAGDRATGTGSPLTFDFPVDLTDRPSTYRPAAVTNLFYWNNLMHDITYRYGFTESAGNFQVNNYGRFGAGANDSVMAEAQDGGGMNNANFSTPNDGSRPRMQMFVWVPPGNFQLQMQSGGQAGNNFAAVRSNFGGFASDLPVSVYQPTATIRVPATATGCTAASYAGFPAGNIAFISSGTCTNIVKAQTAQAAGAAGAIINTGQTDANLAIMTGVAQLVGMPVIGVSTNTAAAVTPTLPATGKIAFIAIDRPVDPGGVPALPIDGDLDAHVVNHEYGHGISNRLTGGRTTVSCLTGNEQMGEGWSDWYAIVYTPDPDRPVGRNRGLGPYLRFANVDGNGIRPTRYSPDMAINPSTYFTIRTVTIPHGVGYVWNTMLWDMYWNLIDKHGFNPSVYDPVLSGGNNRAIYFVTEGMKLQPCSPGFVTGRDAILAADMALNDGGVMGRNRCLIWKAFTRRGLGFGASQGAVSSVTDGTESYVLPTICRAAAGLSPTSFTRTQFANVTTTYPLSIANNSFEEGEDLTWTFGEASGANCNTQTNLPWVSVVSSTGATAATFSSNVQVLFDSTGLAPGTYTGRLCLNNNGTTAIVQVPLTLNVIGTPRLVGAITASSSTSLTIRVTNTGDGTASSIVLDSVSFRTLIGGGTVSLASALPIALGTLAPGAFTDVVVDVSTTGTVTRFSATENGSYTDESGASHSFSMSQVR